MRTHHVIAIIAVILVGFGVKLFFFSAQTAEADLLSVTGSLSVKSVSMDVSQISQNIKNLPEEKIRDMTFVFSDGD